MDQSHPCPKCGKIKTREEMRGVRRDAQCRECKAAAAHAYYLGKSVTTRRNVPQNASMMERLLYYTTGTDDPEGCWLWTGQVDGYDRQGQGIVHDHGRRIKAHIAMWKVTRGSVPTGLFVLHHCPIRDNKLCVNPQHLYLGTKSDNTNDMYRRGGRIVQNQRLSDDDIATIHRLVSRMSQAAISRLFHVSQPYISRIVHQERRTVARGGLLAPVPSLSDADVLTIRALRREGMTLHTLAQRFNRSITTIGFLVRYQSYKHLP
jgi:hypothetical protein